MSSQHSVENKKKIIALSFFVGLFLSVGLASAEITEMNTTCSMWDCETYLRVEGCTGQPLDKVEKRFEKTADIKNIDAKAVKGSDDILYVFGSVKGATQNKWSISIGSCVLDPWWNSSFPYKRNVTINNTQNSNVLTDYQVAVNITYDDDMQVDFDDLRFIDDDDATEIDYWLETKLNSEWAYVWVEIPTIPASDTKDIIIYYGNSEVSTTSNADATFDVYSDFSCVADPCLDADLYNSTNAIAYQSGGKAWTNSTVSGSHYAVIGITNALPQNFSVKHWFVVDTLEGFPFALYDRAYSAGGWDYPTQDDYASVRIGQNVNGIYIGYLNVVTIGVYWNFGTSTWGSLAYYSASAGDEFYVSGKRNQTHIILELYNSTNHLVTNGSAPIAIGSVQHGDDPLYWFYGDLFDNYHTAKISIDDLFVRKYQTPEPTYSIGEEEELPPVPSLICIQYFLEKNIYISFCNVTAISHNQNYCLDNDTLVHNITYTINETDGQFESSEHCVYGCNSESLKCNPEPFKVNLMIIAGVIGFLIVLGIILKIFKMI